MQTRLTLISIILCVIMHHVLATNDIPVTCENGLSTGNWENCAHSLSTLIWNTQTWDDDEPISICKLQCSRYLNGHVSNFQWVWDAKFTCKEQAPGIIGKAYGFKVRRDAMKSAIAQTIEQGLTVGKLTLNDFVC